MASGSSRSGLILFAVYLLLYGGFVAINAFAPNSMELTLISGLNVAIVYGFALIVGAVVLSGCPPLADGCLLQDCEQAGPLPECRT